MQHPQREKSVDYLIRTVSLGMKALANEKIAAYGLSGAQGRVLGAIYHGTQSGMDVSRKDLQKEIQISGPSITSLLNGLEKKGLISRTAASDDARLITLKTTPKGEKIVHDSVGVFQEIRDQSMAGFTKVEIQLLVEFLQRMKMNLYT